MKIKRDDTEESRRYWQLLEENSEIVATWPEWKRGAPGRRKSTPGPDRKEGGNMNINTLSAREIRDLIESAYAELSRRAMNDQKKNRRTLRKMTERIKEAVDKAIRDKNLPESPRPQAAPEKINEEDRYPRYDGPEERLFRAYCRLRSHVAESGDTILALLAPDGQGGVAAGVCKATETLDISEPTVGVSFPDVALEFVKKFYDERAKAVRDEFVLTFPEVCYEREVILRSPGTIDHTERLYRLDWEGYDEKVALRRKGKRHSQRKSVGVSKSELPEKYKRAVRDSRFALPPAYLDEILRNAALACREWERIPELPFDTEVRDMCTRTTVAYVAVAFELLEDCLYSEKENEHAEYCDPRRGYLAEAMAMRFWKGQTGGGAVMEVAGVWDLIRRLVLSGEIPGGPEGLTREPLKEPCAFALEMLRRAGGIPERWEGVKSNIKTITRDSRGSG